MLRRCEPLYEGDSREVCGALFDDAKRMAVCPHVRLDGGDTLGLSADPQYLRARNAEADARAPLPARLRHLGLVSNVPSNAPPPPLPLLNDFDGDGHLRTCTAADRQVPCSCSRLLLRVANTWRKAYEMQPASLVVQGPEAVDLALGASVMARGVVGTVVHLLRRHAPDNAVAVLHQAAEQLRPPVDPDQRSYAERVRERLGMVPRPATPERPRCTCKPTRVAGMGGLFRDPSCPTHGSPPSGLSRLRTDG